MSDDLGERMKRLAKKHAQNSVATDGAQEMKTGKQKTFLFEFYDASQNVILPALERAKEGIESAGILQADVKFADDEKKVSFSIGGGNGDRYSLLVFIADPIKMRVRLHAASGSLSNSKDVSRLAGTENGLTPAAAEYTLQELAEALEERIFEFAEQAMR